MGIIVDQVDPIDAYTTLAQGPNSLLIDVRTRAEWQFVGLPDLAGVSKETILAEWIQFPNMGPNPSFLDEITRVITAQIPDRLFFICRSGSRSLAAAQAVAGLAEQRGGPTHCTNVLEGFEGELDSDGHRGTLNGWKARGLPWHQG
ncbi:MAG: rhodanese-like domain-containing protein [Pseudomonadota bacterium]